MRGPNNSRTKTQGFSLIEILLVIGIVAVLAIAAFIIFPQVQASARANTEKSNIITMAAGAKSLFNGQYAGLDDATAIQGNIVPVSMHDGVDRITSSWGGDVEISGIAAGNPARFTINYVDMPTEVCLKLIPSIIQNFESVRLYYDSANAILTRRSAVSSIVAACQGRLHLMVITSG